MGAFDRCQGQYYKYEIHDHSIHTTPHEVGIIFMAIRN